MKKIILITLILSAASLIFAQDVLMGFQYTDNFNLTTPLYLPDGTTPIPDGYLVEICIPTVAGVKDYINDAHGNVLNNNYGSFTMN